MQVMLDRAGTKLITALSTKHSQAKHQIHSIFHYEVLKIDLKMVQFYTYYTVMDIKNATFKD